MSEGNGSVYSFIENNTRINYCHIIIGLVLIISACSKSCSSTHTYALALLNFLLQLSPGERAVCHGGKMWWR